MRIVQSLQDWICVSHLLSIDCIYGYLDLILSGLGKLIFMNRKQQTRKSLMLITTGESCGTKLLEMDQLQRS